MAAIDNANDTRARPTLRTSIVAQIVSPPSRDTVPTQCPDPMRVNDGSRPHRQQPFINRAWQSRKATHRPPTRRARGSRSDSYARDPSLAEPRPPDPSSLAQALRPRRENLPTREKPLLAQGLSRPSPVARPRPAHARVLSHARGLRTPEACARQSRAKGVLVRPSVHGRVVAAPTTIVATATTLVVMATTLVVMASSINTAGAENCSLKIM